MTMSRDILIFENVEYAVKIANIRSITKCGTFENLRILNGLSGVFQSGELICLMGPSGAGKTTLLHALSGYETSNVIRGNIKLNGKDQKDDETFRQSSCYILQDNHFLPQLTLMQTMAFAANMRMSNETTKEEKEDKIDDILKKLNLSYDLKKTRCDKLSGGQKKRLSIAQELLNDRLKMIFLDEPTSGLDSTTAFEVVQTLRTMARKDRKIILCTIHQPSANLFNLFDRVYVLCDGYCIYNGAPGDLMNYLGNQRDLSISLDHDLKRNYHYRLGSNCPNCNAADFIIDIAGKAYEGVIIKKLVELQKNQAQFELQQYEHVPMRLVVQASNKNVPALHNVPARFKKRCRKRFSADVTQFIVILERILNCIWNDKLLLLARVGTALLLGTLIAILYKDIGNDGSASRDNVACLYMSLFYVMLSSIMLPIITFPTEMDVVVIQIFNSWYKLWMYYLAKTVVDICIETIFTIGFVTMVYWTTNQPDDVWRWGVYVMLCFLLSFAAQSIGLAIGGFFPKEVGILIAVIIMAIIMLFCGFFIVIKRITIGLRWISYLSLIRYAYEGTFLAVYGFKRADLICKDPESLFCVTDPTMVLKVAGIESTLSENFVALLGYFCFVRIAGILVLELRIKLKHKGIGGTLRSLVCYFKCKRLCSISDKYERMP